MIASNQPTIERDADGYIVRFSVDSTPDLPERCFKALRRCEISMNALSIFRERIGEQRSSVTLRSGPCSTGALRAAIRSIVNPTKNVSQHPDPEGTPYSCGIP